MYSADSILKIGIPIDIQRPVVAYVTIQGSAELGFGSLQVCVLTKDHRVVVFLASIGDNGTSIHLSGSSDIQDIEQPSATDKSQELGVAEDGYRIIAARLAVQGTEEFSFTGLEGGALAQDHHATIVLSAARVHHSGVHLGGTRNIESTQSIYPCAYLVLEISITLDVQGAVDAIGIHRAVEGHQRTGKDGVRTQGHRASISLGSRCGDSTIVDIDDLSVDCQAR